MRSLLNNISPHLQISRQEGINYRWPRSPAGDDHRADWVIEWTYSLLRCMKSGWAPNAPLAHLVQVHCRGQNGLSAFVV
jgi:hypothetical protein